MGTSQFYRVPALAVTPSMLFLRCTKRELT